MQDPYRQGARTLPEPPARARRYIRDVSPPGRPGHLILSPRTRQYLLGLSMIATSVLGTGLFATTASSGLRSWLIGAVLLSPAALVLFLFLAVEEIRIDSEELVSWIHLGRIGYRRRVPVLAIEDIEFHPENPRTDPGPYGARPRLELRLYRKEHRFLIAQLCDYKRDELEWLRTYLLTAIDAARAARD
jgi:hypothetical protein